MKALFPPGETYVMNRKGKRGGGCRQISSIASAFDAVRSVSLRNEGPSRGEMTE